jgi:hypothetical protein
MGVRIQHRIRQPIRAAVILPATLPDIQEDIPAAVTPRPMVAAIRTPIAAAAAMPAGVANRELRFQNEGWKTCPSRFFHPSVEG